MPTAPPGAPSPRPFSRRLLLVIALVVLTAEAAGVLLLRAGSQPRIGPPAQRLLSLNVRVAASSDGGGATAVTDDRWRTWAGWRPDTPTAAAPQWLALDLGPGPHPAEVLLQWSAGNNTNWDETRYGGLGTYDVQTSADSSDGSDGTWTTVLTVPTNTVRVRTHLVPVGGARWVRLWITALAPEAPTAALDEVALYDAATGLSTSWLFVGDSITAVAFDRAGTRQPAFADLLRVANPDTWPVTVNAGVNGETVSGALDRVDRLLTLYPDLRYWVLAYGTNDVASDPAGVRAAAWAEQMGELADRVRAAGHVPILGRIPYSFDQNHTAIPAYNAALVAMAARTGTALGPDLYAYFAAHPDELSPDGLHPTDAGLQAINRLWADWHLAEQPR